MNTNSADRKQRLQAERQQRQRAVRAEQVANWYFRLNGFLGIPGFVVHPDQPRRFPLTEADMIAVRFPFSQEIIAGRTMQDDVELLNMTSVGKTLFLLVEVKSDLCNINGPWSNREAGNMQRVIRRLGFADPGDVESIAEDMYSQLRWEGGDTVLQYVAVGARINDGRQRTYPMLRQITWDHIAGFLCYRFQQFPEKLPNDGRAVHEQWPDFGRAFGKRFRKMRGVEDASSFVSEYIRHGRVGQNT